MLIFFATNRPCYKRFSTTTKPSVCCRAVALRCNNWSMRKKDEKGAASLTPHSNRIVRVLLNTLRSGYTIALTTGTYKRSAPPAFPDRARRAPNPATPASLQPLIRDRLILAGRLRKVQPLVDVLLKGH